MGRPLTSDDMGSRDLAALTSWNADWAGLRVAVFGAGMTGFAVADTLAELGSDVVVVAAHSSDETAQLLEVIGVRLELQADEDVVPSALAAFDPELVVVSPGYRPDHALVRWAAEGGIPIWGDVELAWRVRDKVVRPDGDAAEWICITGSRGTATTTLLTATMLVAGGLRAAPAGDFGIPVLDAVRDPGGFDVLVLDLSSAQLGWTTGGVLQPLASVCLNLEDGADRDAAAKVYANTRIACVFNQGDLATRDLVEDAEVQDGARAIGFGLGLPGPSDLGLVEDILVDRAFLEERRNSALELATLDDLRVSGLGTPDGIATTLAAAALARAADVAPAAIRDAIRSFSPDGA